MDPNRHHGKYLGATEPWNENAKQKCYFVYGLCHRVFGEFNWNCVFQNTTSRLQPLDAGIIKKFKMKYRSKLMCYVLARIADDQNT